jgi:zinc transporter 1/2/3
MHLPTSEEDESMAGTFRNLILIVAMSFHGVIEGMAIGLQSTEQNVWLFFLAVSLHECTILFCIGVELISSKTKVLRMITYILVVSLVCPIGIAIGIAVSETAFDKGSLERALVVGSLQGIAAGTLLYVTFFEIFAAEGRKLKGSKYLHILVALLGFAFMVFLQLIGGHVHGHGHSHGGGSDSGLKGSIVHDHDHDHDHDHHDHDHGHAPTGIHNNTLIYDHHHGHNHSHSHHDHDH